MKRMLLFLVSLSVFFAFGQKSVSDGTQSLPFVLLKDGTYIAVKKPVLICEDQCYYVNRNTNECATNPLSEVEGFSRKNDVRWIDPIEFRRIGLKPVRGYLWGVVFFYPLVPGPGLFIFMDIAKRKRVKRMYLTMKLR